MGQSASTVQLPVPPSGAGQFRPAGWQAPLQQLVPLGQLVPAEPQLVVCVWQTPFTQVWPAGHAAPFEQLVVVWAQKPFWQ